MSTPDKDKQFSVRTGDLTSYAAMLGERFALQIDWLGQLLGNAHHPSLGEYKENLLRKVIAEYLPSRYSVGTGFVLFPTQHLRERGHRNSSKSAELPPHQLSKQLDVVVYDSHNYPTVFQDDNFVVLRPESVRAVVEVKGSLTHSDVDNTLDLLLDFGKKWQACRSFYKSSHSPELKRPFLFALAWAVQVDSQGRRQMNGKRLRNHIVKRLSELPLRELPALPLIEAFFIYGDCEVSSIGVVPKEANAELKEGFATTRGRFVRYDENGNPVLSGDKTVASLLAKIHWALDSPFNTAFAYVDQTNRTDVLPHEHEGFEPWLSGDELKYTSPKNFEG